MAQSSGPTQYQIISASTTNELVGKVLALVAQGWLPLGSPFEMKPEGIWYQALTK